VTDALSVILAWGKIVVCVTFKILSCLQCGYFYFSRIFDNSWTDVKDPTKIEIARLQAIQNFIFKQWNKQLIGLVPVWQTMCLSHMEFWLPYNCPFHSSTEGFCLPSCLYLFCPIWIIKLLNPHIFWGVQTFFHPIQTISYLDSGPFLFSQDHFYCNPVHSNSVNSHYQGALFWLEKSLY